MSRMSPEPPDESLSHSRGEGVEVAWGDGPCREKGDAWLSQFIRRGPGEHAVGHAHMEMDMPIECRAETVQEGNGTDAGCGASGPVRCRCHVCRLAHEPFHLAHKDTMPSRRRDKPPVDGHCRNARRRS